MRNYNAGYFVGLQIILLALLLTILSYPYLKDDFKVVKKEFVYQDKEKVSISFNLNRKEPLRFILDYQVQGLETIDSKLTVFANNNKTGEFIIKARAPDKIHYLVLPSMLKEGDNKVEFFLDTSEARFSFLKIKITNYLAISPNIPVSYVIFNDPEGIPLINNNSAIEFLGLAFLILLAMSSYLGIIWAVFYENLSDAVTDSFKFLLVNCIFLAGISIYSFFSPYRIIFPKETLFALTIILPIVTQVILGSLCFLFYPGKFVFFFHNLEDSAVLCLNLKQKIIFLVNKSNELPRQLWGSYYLDNKQSAVNPNSIWTLVSYALIASYLILGIHIIPDSFYAIDQATHFSDILDYVSGEKHDPLGPEAGGSKAYIPGAGYYQLMSFSVFLFKSPYSPVFLITVLHALGMALWEVWGSKFELNPQFRFLMILTGGFSTAAFLNSHIIWNPSIYFFLSTLILFMLLEVRKNPKSGWWAMLLPCISILPQFHLIWLAFWPALIIVCFIFKIFPKGKPAVAGLILSITIWLPYTIHEISTSFHNTQLLLSHQPKQPHEIPGLSFFEALKICIENLNLSLLTHYKIWEDFLVASKTYHEMMNFLFYIALAWALLSLKISFPKTSDKYFLGITGLCLFVFTALLAIKISRTAPVGENQYQYFLMGSVGLSVLLAIGIQGLLKNALAVMAIPWIYFAFSFYPNLFVPSWRIENPNVSQSIKKVTEWAINLEKAIPEGTISSYTPFVFVNNQFSSIAKMTSKRYVKQGGDWLLVYELKEPSPFMEMWGIKYKLSTFQQINATRGEFLYEKIK